MKKSVKAITSLLLAALFAAAPMAVPENSFPEISITAEAASKLSAPTNVKAEATSDSVTLKWDSVKGADGYKVYIYDEKEEKFVKYKNTSSTSCKVTGLTKNKKYYFKIATLTQSGSKVTEHESTKKLSVTTKAKAKSSNLPAAPSEDYTGFATSGGKKYYYENGKNVQGFKKIGSDYYFFTENGMLSGWLKHYGLYYYFDKEGKMAKDVTLSFSGTKYEFDSDGSVVWYTDTKEPTAKYTVKGDELKISIFTSSETDTDAILAMMLVKNNGDKPITIFPAAKLVDNKYSSFDRVLGLLNSDLKYDGKEQTIKANSYDYVTFKCTPNSTWYDKKTRIVFLLKYDNTTYEVTTSSYYGTYYKEAHFNFDD